MSHSPRIMFYHDGRHPLIYMYEPPMQKEEYETGVDELVGTPVEALMFCLGDGRTVLHDTQVGELWGHNVEKWSHVIFRRAHQNARRLIDEGHDPLRIIGERAHAKGMLIYPTLLVQQGRGNREEDVRCSDFRFDNQHLEIGAKTGVDDENSTGYTCLDFAHDEVRAERFALIDETLRKYDVDGFELQLNYQPYYFHPDEVDAGRAVLTAWVRQVYEAVKDSGSDRELVIRVPTSLEGCYGVGMDVASWIDEGIVDVLVGQTFSGPELVNTNADFRELVKAADGSSCRVHAAIQSHVDSDRLAEGTIDIVRACACNYWEQGVDGLYLAHWFGNWPYEASFYEKLRELPDAEVMAPKDKFYYVPTVTGRYAEPETEPGFSMQLPVDLQVGQTVGVDLDISDDLPRWDDVGRVHQVLLRLRVMSTTELDSMQFSLNGVELPASSMRKINEMYRMSAPRYRTGSGYWFVFDLDRDHWPVLGRNRIEVTLTERDAGVAPQIYLRDVELQTKYLKGQYSNRSFVDADLGPHEFASN